MEIKEVRIIGKLFDFLCFFYICMVIKRKLRLFKVYSVFIFYLLYFSKFDLDEL